MPPYASSPHGLPAVSYPTNPYAPQSPYGSSPGGYAGSPQNAFSPAQQHQPFQPQQQQQHQWNSQPPTPVSQQQMSPPAAQNSSQMMPPPPRPNKDEKDERINAEDFGDTLFGSGINLKEEENYMHMTFQNQHSSFTSTQPSSFGSSTMTPNGSFSLLTQSTSFGSQNGPNGAYAGTMGAPQSQEQIEAEMKRKREQAARQRAESQQYHMNNQFLLTNAVRKRYMARTTDEGVQPQVQGLYKRLDEPRTHVLTNGNQGIAAVDTRPEYTAERGAPFEQIMSLISLAAQERMRGLVDEAFALARARKYGDHGRVPPEFADLATGEGERREEDVVPQNVTRSQWDKPAGAETNGELTNGVNGSHVGTPLPQHTISFTGSVASALRGLAKRDKAAEEERIKRREARRKRAQEAANAAEEAAIENQTPEAAPEAKMSKKEATKLAKDAKQDDGAKTTNQTAAMMALGSKGKKYSWMTGGGGDLTNKYAKNAKPVGSGPATPTAVKSEAASPGASGMARGGSAQGAAPAEKVVEWGDWREDGEGGRGIQARDWAYVLERDGKEKIALEKAYSRLS
ncbi:Transcription initiation factor TFIID component TAF4 family [Teratosphaeria destructans]|uniref:Transcription initiation factor TFIID subunit 4 n=1 Tax=Teratosphaeria destructans TaxID=418781 RepID=A0A9W7SWD7_9PEZI|nr:Transcription initiation factor TFIID component TAF4 family [Teratosphaeria destructans]